MKVLVINPNTSESMTQHIRRELEKIKSPHTVLEVKNLSEGPSAIQSAYDAALAAPYVVEMVKKANEEGYDAVIIACFSDPGIDAAKEVSQILVLGIAEAAFHIAALLGYKFCIMTPLKTRIPSKEEHVRRLGLGKLLASVRAMNMTVLETDANPDETKTAVLEIGKRAIEEDGVEVIILGCAGMAGYSEELAKQLGVPVLDPTSVALKVAEAMVDLGLTHSKIGLFSRPLSIEREEMRS
ncbi:MAG: aspartate/glutamate racemase family protein [Anaerolineae bacterium]|nr:aspartate/glutamate racemase family protein [Anaerolineae bacterium]